MSIEGNRDGQWRQGRRVAIIGAGPGGGATAMAMKMQGYDVRLYERAREPKALGGGVLLSVPVLAVLRSFGMDIDEFGSFTRTEFLNNKGKHRVKLGFNEDVERAMGIRGWHYGVLRQDAFKRMLDRLDEIDPTVLKPDRAFKEYEDRGKDVVIRFENGEDVECDLLVGADGIRSKVSYQAFGDHGLFHTGLRLWLAWCDAIPGVPNDLGRIHHSRDIQASYFPMLHDGEHGFEWWIVEPTSEGAPVPADPAAHIRSLLEDFPSELMKMFEATDFDAHIFRWEIYNRPSLKSYTKGRVACVGDACHPVSPYAAYGMGMAIEDGYFLARAFGGAALDSATVARGTARYNDERVAYCNQMVEFARDLGNRFHHANAITARIRDLVLDHTPILQRSLNKNSLDESAKMSLRLKELHVA